jgi:hypothetical protein
VTRIPAVHWERVKSAAPRPFDLFLAAQVIGQKSTEAEKKTAVAIAPFETDPERWAALPWTFEATGQPVPFSEPDAEGWRWELVTIRDVLQGFKNRHPSDFVDGEGSPCCWYTRGPLQRRSVRRGHKFVLTKESLAWSDDPALAFWAQPQEAFRAGGTCEATSSENWEAVRKALALVGPAEIAKRVGLTPRNARYWAAGATLPNDTGKVAAAVVAIAAKVGLLLPEDHALGNEAICAELSGRAATAQCFVGAMAALLAERQGGMRNLARMLDIDKETLRGWLALSGGELRPIKKTNAIIPKLAKFARSEIRALRRRITTNYGPAGDRQAIIA